MNELSLRTNFLPPITKFGSYAAAVKRIPELSEEEEKELASQFIEKKDNNAAFKLILSHLRLPVLIARKHLGYGLPIEDLVQEGNIGLMKAVKKYDPTRGVRLSTVAFHWIRAEIRAYILKNWRMVKVATTEKLRHLFFKTRQERQHLENIGFSGKELDIALAKKLNVSLADLDDIQLRLEQDVSIDASINGDGITLGETLCIPMDENYQTESNISIVNSCLEHLPTRTRKILTSRYLQENPATLSELAKDMNLSVGRIAQIESQGLSKIKKLAAPLLGA